jgi:cysteinyl-tRNA synthetase
MRALVERLVASGNAYVAQDHALFSVPSMPDYGKLARRSLDEMIAGARIEVAPYKRDPMDFVLWKPSSPGEPAWPSPAGIAAPGRPGWHLECSAMSWKNLGETFDIHGGGIDLVFPHHENEIAQSRCAFHTPVMANYWMHNGFLQVEGEKMSKSLGNFFTIREVLQQAPNEPRWGEVVRLNMLKTHYRQPIDWTQSSLSESMVFYANLRRAVINAHTKKAPPSDAMMGALKDDLNTPLALAELHRLASQALCASGDSRDAAAELVGSLLLLGFERAIDHVSEDNSLREGLVRAFNESSAREIGLDPSDIDERVATRAAARRAKNFKESDRIRDELAAMGVVLKDSKDGTTWEISR